MKDETQQEERVKSGESPVSELPATQATRSRNAAASLVVAIVGVGWLAVLCWAPAVLQVAGKTSGICGIGLLALLPALALGLGVIACRSIRVARGQLVGDGLARAAIWLSLGTMMAEAALAVWLFHRARYEGGAISWAGVMRTRMRSLSAAIESYYVDHNMYPAWAMGNRGPAGTWSFNYWRVRESAKASEPWVYLPTFVFCGEAVGRKLATLTTPTGYVSWYPSDIFAPAREATFVYWCVFPGQPDPSGKIVGKDSLLRGGAGWILVSPGPDRRYDIPGDWDVYDPSISQPSARLLAGTNKKGRAFTYDPTNGAMSGGDLWRVKQ